MSKMGIAVISLLSRRRQFRGARPLAHPGGGVFPRHAVAHLRHRHGRHPAQGAGAARRAPGREDSSRSADRRLLPLPPRRRDPCLGGEPHPHAAERRGAPKSYQTFKRYSEAIDKRPPIAHPRPAGLPCQRPKPISHRRGRDRITEIRKRFVTPGMSLGALSPEAHGTLNIAMNRIGAKSDSGEGGEDPARFKPRPNGDNANSAIKQVASGRFGVTAEYLTHCREIEIKVAQGAKPGEGGQLPGFKVTAEIARLRHATPGVMLISPAAASRHLFDRGSGAAHLRPEADQPRRQGLREAGGALRHRHHRRRRRQGQGRCDPDLRPCRRHRRLARRPASSMPACPGRWASPRSHQVLTLNRLRHRVRLRTDGGIKTGRDVVIAAMLGAEEFGIGTAGAGRHGLHHGAAVPFQHLPGRRLHPGPAAAREASRARRRRW